GRPGNQARASAVLRAAGLAHAFAGQDVHDSGDVGIPAPDPTRGAATSLVNEAALVAMTDAVETRVRAALGEGRTPVLYGGDCTTLLGSMPAFDGGLVFVDGHEDTTPLDVSEDGEAANTEIGLLLGLTGRLLRGPLAHRRGTLAADRLAMLGQRDRDWRRQFNVGSLRDHGVWLRDVDDVAADPAGAGRAAVQHVAGGSGRWWLHVDLDVLDPVEFPAQGLPDVADEPGGLTRAQLAALLLGATGEGGCAGLSVAIYDPDQDPDGSGARAVVDLIRTIAPTLG
ncbi:MAG: arginase, partial [Pseudonocardiales bacterium]|nr:arginase [Pseudonocardiales bacterium]